MKDTPIVPEYEPPRPHLTRAAAAQLLAVHRDESDRMKRARTSLIEAARREGMTYKEIGQILGLTEGAVRYYTRRATTEQQDAA